MRNNIFFVGLSFITTNQILIQFCRYNRIRLLKERSKLWFDKNLERELKRDLPEMFDYLNGPLRLRPKAIRNFYTIKTLS